MAIFNLKRARKVLAPLYEDYVLGQKFYANIRSENHAPQRIFVPDHFGHAGTEHRRWLFFATMTDRREESMRVYESHRSLAQHSPELYTSDVCIMPKEKIERRLRQYKVGSPGQSANYWPRAATTLFHEFGGDPLGLYEGRTINNLVAYKKRSEKLGGDPLPGFGPKILSLLAIYLAELDVLAPVSDAFPVDVHVQRFCISTGILEGTGKVFNEEAERILRPGLCLVCKEMGWGTLDLSHAIWFLGNRLCTVCPRSPTAKAQCPAYSMCGGAIASNTYFRKGYWLLNEERYRKGGDMNLRCFDDMPLFAQCAV